MKLLCFSVYDKAVQAFLPPFYGRSKGEAVRSFMQACADEKHQFSVHAGDYVLYALGEFDDGSGLFLSDNPIRVISALECLPDKVAVQGNGKAVAPDVDPAEGYSVSR